MGVELLALDLPREDRAALCKSLQMVLTALRLSHLLAHNYEVVHHRAHGNLSCGSHSNSHNFPCAK